MSPAARSRPAQPARRGIWGSDLSARRRLAVDLTPREPRSPALLIEGLTSKLIGKRLEISPRLSTWHRARPDEGTARDHAKLVQKLLRA